VRTKITSLAMLAAISLWMAGCAKQPSVEAKELEAKAREDAAIREAENNKPRFVAVPAGTSVTVRLNQSLSTATNRSGERFSATLAQPVVVEGQTVIPIGTEVKGVVRQSYPSGRLKGRAVLTLALQEIEVAGGEVVIDTTSRTSVSGRHRKRNWAWIGGGSGTGAVIGAIASGGTGAAIGAGSGAAAGLITAVFTGKKQVRLPAESQLTFRLSQPIEIPAS
jgi:hypothetical protein